MTVAIAVFGAWVAFAQDYGVDIAATVEPSVGFFAKTGQIFVELFVLLAVVGLPLFCIGHMLFVIHRTRRLKHVITVEEMTANRLKKGLLETSTKEENDICDELIIYASQCFTSEETREDGVEMFCPKNMKEVQRMHILVDEAGKLLPTDEDTLQFLNEYREIVYENSKRSFNGSNKLLWLGGLVSFGLCFFMLPMGIMFALFTGVYYLANCVPEYMVAKKEHRGGGNGWLANMLMAAGVGVLGSDYTMRTHYTDSSNKDSSANFMARALDMVILFVVACTIVVWAAFSYLRNYVLF